MQFEVEDNMIMYKLLGLTITLISWRDAGTCSCCFNDSISIETNNWYLELSFYPMLFDVVRDKVTNHITNVDLTLPEFELSWCTK